MNMWGIHNDTLTAELVDDGFVSIGWDPLGDLRELGTSREELKASLAAVYPDSKPSAIAGWAGILLRFRDEMRVGDVVVAPYKPDSTINLGLVTCDYYFEGSVDTHRHRRRVEWKRVGIPRTVFSQPALYEIGAFLTIFGVRKHDAEFRAVLEAGGASVDEVTRIVDAVAEAKPTEESDEPRASPHRAPHP
jgi:restriction system protein